jgi:uncharacterized membrane protein YcjF (UPF0283 family)
MSDEQVIKLLGEIRDLQKQGVDNQKLALANQQESIERQKVAVDNQKKAMIRARNTLYTVVGLFIVLFGVPMVWWVFAWTMRFVTR